MVNYNEDLDAESALDHNLQEKRHAEDWVYAAKGDPDCEVTLGTGDLGAGNGALSVNGGTPLVGGSKHPFGEQSLDVPTGDSKPRKDLVVADETGPTVVEGTSEADRYSSLIDDPTNAPLTQAHRPAPPDLAAVPGAVLAMVVVPADATTITADEIHDLRSFAIRERRDVKTTNTGELSGNVTANTTLHRIIGGDAGEVISGPSFGAFERSQTFLNTTYDFDLSFFQHFVDLRDLEVKNAELVANVSCFVDVGAGETVDVRVRDRRNSTIIAEILDVNNRSSSGWVSFAVPTASSDLAIEYRTDPGDNSNTIFSPSVVFGGRL